MFRKVLLAVAALVAVVAVLAGIKVAQIRSMIAAGAEFRVPPETVSSTHVERVRWDSTLAAVGTVSAVQGVELKTEVPGLVERVGFESGGTARVGQVLVELDRSAEQAQLRSAQAREELTRANLARAHDLFGKQLLPQSDLDAAEAAFRQATSEVEAFRVAIAKKTVRAPFTGRLGIRQVQVGQLADAGTPVVSLQSLDPVHVDFSLPEQAASSLSAGMTVRVASGATPGRTFEGTLTAIDPQVDPSSRHIRLQATLAGTNGALLPGMSTRVSVVLPEVTTPLVVPVTAVQFAPYGDSVFVIADAVDEKTRTTVKRVRMTTVRLGETRGDFVAVENGLTEGQEIATSGVFKLHNDAEVVVNDELAPAAETTPNPKNS